MRKTSVLFTLAGMLLLSVLIFVLENNQAASWQIYQERFFTVQIAKLQTELKNATDYKVKGQIESEIAQLKMRQPQVVNLVLPNGKVERCQTCHMGIEEISPSHPAESFGCAVCHGGNPMSLDANTAHAGWFGNGHPGNLQSVSLSCGGTAPNGSYCHSGNAEVAKNQVDLVKTSLMSTKAGELSMVRKTFGLKDKDIANLGTASQVENPLDGSARQTGLINNCLSQCHQSNGILPSFLSQNSNSKTNYSNGCEVCHVLSNPDHTYVGADVTIPSNETGHGMIHRLTTQIPYTQCNQCHNQGLHDAVNMKFTPRKDMDQVIEHWGQAKTGWNDRIKDYYLPGELFSRCEVSLDCIDCHTRQDVMGDGHKYSSEYEAVHIQCQDCHGTIETFPLTKNVNDPKDLAFDEKITNPVFPQLNLGQQIVVTGKGEELPFVRHQDSQWYLVSRITGKSFTIPLVKGSLCRQNVKEQNADACHKCHSAPK